MLSIIIPVYTGWPQTRKCLEALRRSRCREFVACVVNHGPDDAVAQGVRDYPEVVHLRGASSLWWAGATNVGIRHALEQGADRVMFLNHDCYVGQDTIGLLLEQAQAHQGAIIAPVQREEGSGRPLVIAPEECLWLGFADGRQGPATVSQEMQRQRLLPVSLIRGGRGVVVPAGVFARVGLLDEENLPHYYADHDFFLRCRGEGVGLFVDVATEVFIDNSQTSLAWRPENLTVARFIRSLREPRSHRNMRDLRMLFRKHYPLPALSWVGFGLSIIRYLLVYGVKRMNKVLSRSGGGVAAL